ncbi:PREDICTED: adenylate kinase 9-like, partial [Hipposideros armiger]|uniref:Adenylate kinase 9-like n=1 Tax=Hipposideros armiger TaxID=186990 RepID=A0A8B7SMA7_HIPAR
KLEYGLKRLSVGEALRYVLNNQPDTELALMLNWHLHKGMTAPDELAIEALEISLMESICNTAGVIIDGYPVTKHQTSLLEARSIIPMVIFELDVPSKEIFKRLLLERKKKEQSLPYPLHNSTQITAVKNSHYHKNIDEIRQYYQEQHQNWYVIDGFHSKWWVWNEVIKNIQMVNKYIQIYLENIKAGKAACIDNLCITPQELISRLGEFGQFCPVSLAESYELIDCSVTESLEFAAEFRGHYYKMSSREKLNKFLENPELYVPPLAPYPLPTADMIPKRLTLSELKKQFPKCAELQGYCPVTYQDGKQRYEALVPGDIKYALEYRNRIYICESNEKLQKFLRLPLKYWNQKLPYKLPPLKEPVIDHKSLWERVVREDEEISEEGAEEDDEDIENILEDEFPKDEEMMSEEDEEQETDALERLRSELGEKYEADMSNLQGIQLSEGETIKPIENSQNPLYPVIHRQYIYFLSSKETKEKFMKNPIKYIRQPKPKPTMPIRIAIVGPPKSGKTTGDKWHARDLEVFVGGMKELVKHRLREKMLQGLERKVGRDWIWAELVDYVKKSLSGGYTGATMVAGQ